MWKKCFIDVLKISELYSFTQTYALLYMNFPKLSKCNIAFNAQQKKKVTCLLK